MLSRTGYTAVDHCLPNQCFYFPPLGRLFWSLNFSGCNYHYLARVHESRFRVTLVSNDRPAWLEHTRAQQNMNTLSRCNTHHHRSTIQVKVMLCQVPSIQNMGHVYLGLDEVDFIYFSLMAARSHPRIHANEKYLQYTFVVQKTSDLFIEWVVLTCACVTANKGRKECFPMGVVAHECCL